MSPISFGTAACNDKKCPFKYPHSHLELDEASYPSDSPGFPNNQRVRQANTVKNENIHTGKNGRINQNRESSRVTSPITFTGANPKPHSQQAAKIALYQPSLAAGGSVDLSRTFTLTPHGTFSFGGKRNLPKILSKARLAAKSKRVSNQHRNKILVGNPSLASYQGGSPLKSQQYISPISTRSARSSSSPIVLDHEMESIEQQKSLVSSPSSLIIISHTPWSDTQMIIADQKSFLAHKKEAESLGIQRRLYNSYQSTVTDSYFPNILNRDP